MRPPARSCLLAPLVLALGGCGAEAPDGPVGEAALAQTVGQAAGSSCSTLSVKGLSDQIIAVGNCISPGAFVQVPALPNVSFSSTVFPYLEQPAKDAFVACLSANPGMSMGVNSMLRTVAQQYLLYQWYQSSQCGIGLAAVPGNSNHETGLAFDTDDHAAWQGALATVGFQWYGSADPVHFDYAGGGAVNYLGTDVQAFQKLWNANNPGDQIAEDGQYGPQTDARLQQSPADGFAIVPGCGPSMPTTTSSAATSGAGGAGGSGAGGSGAGGSGAGGSGAGGGAGGGAPHAHADCGCALPRTADPASGAIAVVAAALGAAARRRRRRVAG